MALLEPGPERSAHFIDGNDLDGALSRIDDLRQKTVQHIVFQRAYEAPGEPSPERDLQIRTRLYELGVRNPGYFHHQIGLLEKLYRPLNEDIRDLAGFTIDEALRLIKGIEESIEEAMQTRKKLSGNMRPLFLKTFKTTSLLAKLLANCPLNS